MKIKKLLNLSILTLFITSNAYAGVTVGAPSTTLTQVANSMNFTSTTNNNINPSVTSSQTSTVMNTTTLIENVTKAADEAGLDIDQEAIDILLNKTREEYATRKELRDDLTDVMDALHRLEDKLDKILSKG